MGVSGLGLTFFLTVFQKGTGQGQRGGRGYHLAVPSVGVVSGTSVQHVEDELAAHGVHTFFADSRWPLSRDFARSVHWKRRGTIEAGGQRVILFTPRGRALGPHGDRFVRGHSGESGEPLE